MISITSDQNGKKQYMDVMKTPILLDSGYVQKTDKGEVIIVDPKKLLTELKKLNIQTPQRRLLT